MWRPRRRGVSACIHRSRGMLLPASGSPSPTEPPGGAAGLCRLRPGADTCVLERVRPPRSCLGGLWLTVACSFVERSGGPRAVASCEAHRSEGDSDCSWCCCVRWSGLLGGGPRIESAVPSRGRGIAESYQDRRGSSGCRSMGSCTGEVSCASGDRVSEPFPRRACREVGESVRLRERGIDAMARSLA